MDVGRSVEAVWRIESPRLIATLSRLTGDLGIAEDLASDAFLAALEQWPRDGIPPRPGAWLMTTARHKAIDRLRREQTGERKHALLAVDQCDVPDVAEAALQPTPDDVLTLVF